MAKLITGLFKSRSSATLAVEDLIRHGFSQDDISMLISDTSRGHELVIDERTKSAEGLAIGSAIGGIIGALALGMTSVSMIGFPGVDMYFSGQAFSALTGFGAGSLIGGLIGGLTGLTLSEHEAVLREATPEHAGILVAVYAHKDRALEAKKVMDAAGGDHLKVESVLLGKKKEKLGVREETPVEVRKEQPGGGFTYG